MSKSSIGIKHSEVRAMALASPAARASYEQELLASARKALARGELIIPISTGTFIEVVEALEAAEKRNAELECITGALREIRPGHITIAGEKIGIYMRDEVDAALASSGVAVEGE